MKSYSSYPELRRIIVHFIRLLSNKAIKEISYVLSDIDTNCDCYSDKEKCYRINTFLHKHLWEIDEAITIGFHTYQQNIFAETQNLLNYHDKNCLESCKVCEHEIKMNNYIQHLGV